MNSTELRERIIALKGYPTEPGRQLHGTANYLSPLLGFLNDGMLGAYGASLGCNNLEELLTAANKLKTELKSELSESDWEAYFWTYLEVNTFSRHSINYYNVIQISGYIFDLRYFIHVPKYLACYWLLYSHRPKFDSFRMWHSYTH